MSATFVFFDPYMGKVVQSTSTDKKKKRQFTHVEPSPWNPKKNGPALNQERMAGHAFVDINKSFSNTTCTRFISICNSIWHILQ